MDDKEIGIICLAVDPDRLPGDPASTRGHYCHECDAEVWMSKLASQFWDAHPRAEILCPTCAVKGELDEVAALPGDKAGEAIANHPQIKQILRVLYGPRDPT
jgi:hypothetical protein